MKRILWFILMVAVLSGSLGCNKHSASDDVLDFPEELTDRTTMEGVCLMNCGSTDHSVYYLDGDQLYAKYSSLGKNYLIAQNVTTARTAGNMLIYIAWKGDTPSLHIRDTETGKHVFSIDNVEDHLLVHGNLIVRAYADKNKMEANSLYRVSASGELIKLTGDTVYKAWGYGSDLYYSDWDGTVLKCSIDGVTKTVFSLDEYRSADSSEKAADSTERITWLEYAIEGVCSVICPQENAILFADYPDSNQTKLIKVPLDEPEKKEEKPLTVNDQRFSMFSDGITIELHENDQVILPGFNYNINSGDQSYDYTPLHVYDSIYVIGSPDRFREHGLFYSGPDGSLCYTPRYNCIAINAEPKA